MKKRGCIDDIHFASELLHQRGVFVEDIRLDKLGFQSVSVFEEIEAYFVEAATEICSV
jgi:transposase